jgi:hypothetical protein
MPYGMLGDALAVIAAVVAFFQAGLKGRIVIAWLMGSSFVIPLIAPSPTVSIVCFVARILIAIGCYLYIRWSNAV